MARIKLPGSNKQKSVVLVILVIVAVAIIGKNALENKRNINKIEEDIIKEETIISGEKTEEEEIEKVEFSKEEEELYNTAYNMFFQGDYNGAIEKANSILEKNSNNYKAYNIRGVSKAFSMNFEEAMKDIDKALEIKSDYGYGRYNKAFTYELYDKFDDALIWYDKALEVENYMWSYYGKASIYGRRGDAANTVKYLKEAISVEGAKDTESGIKKEARTEKDFDLIRGNLEFEELIK